MRSKLRIAIAGTRGIPNNYGGFEQCAEKLSLAFVQKGHDVTVYNPTDHLYGEEEWEGIRIDRIFSREKTLKFLNTFVFDYLCLKKALRDKVDIILELGYSPSALFYFLNNQKTVRIVTNMAGMEWKRSKWNPLAKKIIQATEAMAVRKSNALIADNLGIRDYILKKYNALSYFIPYGAELFHEPNDQYLEQFEVAQYQYYLLIARFQPDNNIEMILDGYTSATESRPFLVIGNHGNRYGSYLKNKYSRNKGVQFVDGIYDYDKLSSLRWFSRMYFHGHSCGGTNPSLLEAMASNAYIAAHDNAFNRYVLEDSAFYFQSARDIASIIKKAPSDRRSEFTVKNRDKIKTIYRWDRIAEDYLRIFRNTLDAAGSDQPA